MATKTKKMTLQDVRQALLAAKTAKKRAELPTHYEWRVALLRDLWTANPDHPLAADLRRVGECTPEETSPDAQEKVLVEYLGRATYVRLARAHWREVTARHRETMTRLREKRAAEAAAAKREKARRKQPFSSTSAMLAALSAAVTKASAGAPIGARQAGQRAVAAAHNSDWRGVLAELDSARATSTRAQRNVGWRGWGEAFVVLERATVEVKRAVKATKKCGSCLREPASDSNGQCAGCAHKYHFGDRGLV